MTDEKLCGECFECIFPMQENRCGKFGVKEEEEVKNKPYIKTYDSEIYGEAFDCPNCKEDGVFTSYNFCPYCGVKLKEDSDGENG